MQCCQPSVYAARNARSVDIGVVFDIPAESISAATEHSDGVFILTGISLRRVFAALVAMFLAGLMLVVASPARADYASGGTGRFGGSIEWISWGADGAGIPNAGETRTNTFSVGAETVAITCTVNNIADITGGAAPAGSVLSSYRSGDYVGDGLDNIYNVGGTGTKNQLVTGLVTQGSRTAQFNFACTGTLNGAAFPLSGLVMADAESTNNVEYIAATIPPTATWRVLDRYRNNADPACANNSVLAARTPANALTLSSTGECGTGSPMAVAYMDGTSAATNVTVKGGGKEAIALGVFVTFDHGDAPASYGDAAHLEDFPFTGGTIPADGSKTRISGTDFALAAPVQPSPRLGATVDPEASAQYSQNADGDDNSINTAYGGGNDEDAITAPAPATVLPGSAYTLAHIACTGAGQVAGWIDWNGNGVFDPGERSAPTDCAGTTTVSLGWTVPADVTSQAAGAHSFLRLRIAPTAAGVTSPSGAVIGGEDEDYPIDVLVPQPASDDDSATTPFGTAVTINPLANDVPAPGTSFTAGSLRLIDPTTGAAVTTLLTAAGTYSVNSTTGAITFSPAIGFHGPTPPIKYTVNDNLGRASTAVVGVIVQDPAKPSPVADTPTTPQGTPITFDPSSNDRPGPTGAPVVPSSLRLLDAAGNPVTTLTVAGQGTYTVDPGTGKVTFTPLPTFTGVATPVKYRITDTFGATSTSAIVPTVTPVTPLGQPDQAVTPLNAPVTLNVLANDTPGQPSTPLDPSAVALIDPITGNAVRTLTVAGQGVFTVNPTSGAVTFTPVTGFTGPVTPPTYRVTDANGSTAISSISITVSTGPDAEPDVATTGQNQPVTLSPVSNDVPGDGGAQLDPTTLQIIDPTSGALVNTVTVADVGTYTVGPNGTVRFVPVPAFSGQAPPLTYTVLDTDGSPATSTLQVTVVAQPPASSPDVAASVQGTPVTINPVGNDSSGASGAALEPTTLRLLDAAGTAVTTLTVPGEGTYTVNPATGQVTFTPLPGFTGTGTPVRYRIADANGATTVSTITPVITPTAPTANPDRATTDPGQPVTTAVLINDAPGAGAPLVPTSLRLVNAEGALVTTLTTAAGVYTANDDGTITFTPAPGFIGAAPPITYSIADTNGTRASTTYTVTVAGPTAPTAVNDTATTRQNTPATIHVLANDRPGGSTLVAGSVRLIDPQTGRPATHVTVAGVGTWTVHSDGTVTFTPAPGFTGKAVIQYQVTDSLGRTVQASITVTVTPTATTSPPTTTNPPTVAPTATTNPPITSPPKTTPPGLATTGSDLRPITTAAVLMLLTGLLLIGATKRRRRAH